MGVLDKWYVRAVHGPVPLVHVHVRYQIQVVPRCMEVVGVEVLLGLLRWRKLYNTLAVGAVVRRMAAVRHMLMEMQGEVAKLACWPHAGR